MDFAQIWIAVSVYVLVAIVKKNLKLDAELYNILQILTVTLFEKVSINEILTNSNCKIRTPESPKQLMLIDL